jgi:hypothetical protein
MKMKINSAFILSILLAIVTSSCSLDKPRLYDPMNKKIRYVGRIDKKNPIRPRLSGSASYIEVNFWGKSCEMILQDENKDGGHNYLSIILDGNYIGRMKVSADTNRYTIVSGLADTLHHLIVCKATEAQNGYVEFIGISCKKVYPLSDPPAQKIEFIGNSITCGMGNDTLDLSCQTGEWYDHHNAYFAYGPLLSRSLNLQWFLSSVSGIGIERNWNGIGPTMPLVYDNTYLDLNDSVKWDFASFVPDIVSICMGTNDFSDGDSAIPRPALNSESFVEKYIEFVKHVHTNYPKAIICLLSSPMLDGEKKAELGSNLEKIKSSFIGTDLEYNLHIYTFNHKYSNGCDSHPNKKEHEEMANELIPFFQQFLK